MKIKHSFKKTFSELSTIVVLYIKHEKNLVLTSSKAQWVNISQYCPTCDH